MTTKISNPASPVIPYGRQSINDDDIQSVVDVLKTSWITQGPKVAEFEKAIANYCGAKYAVAVSNGTAGLHLACLAAGLKAGDEAVTTPMTFVATANAISYTGARPVFADIQYHTVNINPAEIEQRISKRSRAILPVHFAGLPVDLTEINQIAKKHKLLVIEDACHAFGASYQGRKIGSCDYSDMTVFSFHPVKAFTTGEGGCITTNNPKLYKRLKSLANHGIYRDEAIQKKSGGWAYELRDLGYNFRLTDLQCALGISQLNRVDRFIENRRAIADRYIQAFSNLNGQVLLPQLNFEDRESAWHLFLFRIQSPKAGVLRRKIYETLKADGIYSQIHYIPVTQQPFYRKLMKSKKQSCPNAEKYYSETLSLPLYPDLSDEDIQRVIETTSQAVRDVFKKA